MDWAERINGERTAMALLDAGNPAGAEARLRQILSQNPNDARALALITYCKLALDDKKAALEAARNAAAINPDDYLVRRALLSALSQNQKLKEAETIAAALAAEDPEDSAVLYNLAIARWNKKDYHGANALFEQAETYAAGSASDLLRIAYLRLDQWRWADAEALARDALLLDPTQSHIFVVLSECALAQERPDEAYDLALEALRLDPHDKAIFRLLTRAQVRRKGWLKPFAKGIDWLVEMDRRGALLLALMSVPLTVIILASAAHDLRLMRSGQAPALIITLAAITLLLYGVFCYAIAFNARLKIRRDLKRIALPNF